MLMLVNQALCTTAGRGLSWDSPPPPRPARTVSPTPCNPYGASALLHCLVAYLHTVVGAHVQKFKQLQEEDSEEEKWD